MINKIKQVELQKKTAKMVKRIKVLEVRKNKKGHESGLGSNVLLATKPKFGFAFHKQKNVAALFFLCRERLETLSVDLKKRREGGFQVI